MEIIRIENNPINSNCFIIFQNERSILIDPGSRDVTQILNTVNGKDVDYMILTHEHFDHIWSVGSIRQYYPMVKVIATKQCSQAITSKKSNISFYYDGKGFEIQPADITIDKETSFVWNGIDILFIPTPGHTSGSMCIKIGDTIFTGDTIIKGEKVVTKFPGGNKIKLKESINYLLQTANKRDFILYCGHGENWMLSEIKENNLI